MTLSLCLMVRNEEARLAACLQSAADLVDETIVVDTGSTDGTRELAAKLGARVFEFPWCDDFAAARNECIRHAKGDFIFWMDADERVDEANREKLRKLFQSLSSVSSQLPLVSSKKTESSDRSSVNSNQSCGRQLTTDYGLLTNSAYVMKCLSVQPGETQHGTVVDHMRLFRNQPDVRWKYRVHEQILPALRATAAEVIFTDIVIQHTGYVDPAYTSQKLERNLRLLHLDHAEHPNDPYILFHLGWAHLEFNRLPEAVGYLRASLDGSHPGDSIVKKLFALLAQAHHRLGQSKDALAACRAGRARYPEDPELLYLEGIFHRERREWGQAIGCLQKLVGKAEEMNRRERGESAEKKIQEAQHIAEDSPLPSVASAFSAVKNSSFGSVDVGTTGYLARHQLALVYYQQGRLTEAEAEWKLALADRPRYLDALKGLGEMYLKQARWTEIDRVIEMMKEEKARNHELHEYEVAILQVRGMMARKEFEKARAVLEPIATAQPRAIYPRIILSHVYLQEGKDLQSADHVLREIVELDPAQAETWRNLAGLLWQLGWLDEAEEVCRTGWRHFLDYGTLPLLLGITLADQHDIAAAEMCFLRLLELPFSGPMPPEHLEARHQLALIYQKTGHPAEAEAQWRTILAERPDYAPAIQAVKQSPSSNGALHHDPKESAFNGNPSPEANELASIIILCCNQLEYSRQCLESVLSNTRQPYELILVDNGSTDGTPEYLKEIQSRGQAIRVHIIRNETNVGYPAGCNQALAQAHGRYLVFLNNDVIVTAGWLDGLMGWTKQGGANVGLIGPVTNCASGPQQVPVDYQDLAGLPAFGVRRRQEWAGRAMKVDRLTGFCMLVRREVFDLVGNFDEQFGLGFFDDDDLCVRAREAGFGLLVAEDVFVHHFGNRTFRGLGINCRELLVNNFERFKEKWGSERAAGYHLVGSE
jgi:GT2 family glycosyltransferase/Tfp pilus assembly protein PilF